MSSEPAAKRQRKEGSSPAEIAADLAECSKQLSSKMREVRDSKAKVSKTSDPAHQAKIMECLLLFVDLKRLVRTGFENVQQATETTGKKRAEVDALHLSLQNLLYEKTHILKEIKRCHLFRSSHDDIEMIPEAQFVSESSADAKVLAADPHKKMLARLDHEGKERNRLALQLKGLKNTKDSLEKEIEAREAKLTKLPQKVKKIVEDVADDLYPLIGEGNELSFNDAQKRDFESLPMPLYLLYMNLEAHKQRKFGGPGSIVVTVEGDVEAAKEQLLQVATELTTDDGAADDDAEETGDVADAAEDEAAADGGSSRGNSKGGSAAAQHTPLVDVFPLRLNLKLLVGGGGAAAADAEQQFIEIQFCYLRKLNVVTVVNVGEVDNHELLSSLYPGDDGLDLPSTRALYELDAATKKLFSEFVTTVGRPYKWAQSVADLDADRADADMEECGGRVAKRETRQTLTRVIADIRHKVKSVHALGEQLKALAKLNIELPASATAKNFPLEAKSVLQSWKRCDKVPAAQLSPYLIKPGNSYYNAEFKRGKLKMGVLVIVPKLYPLQPPCFKLSFIGEGGVSEVDANINVIEKEANIHYTELIKGDEAELLLLPLQMRRVQMCFDVFCETQTDATGKEGSVGKVFVRGVRGKDRIRPYVFDHQQGLFVHRTSTAN